MCDVLLVTEDGAKELAESILVTKAVCLQTKYMGTHRTKIRVHGVIMDISVEYVGAFFAKYGQAGDVVRALSKTGVATGDFGFQVTLRRKGFLNIPNTLTGRVRNMFLIVEVRRPLCWSRGAAVPLAKMCPGWNTAPQSCTSKQAVGEDKIISSNSNNSSNRNRATDPTAGVAAASAATASTTATPTKTATTRTVAKRIRGDKFGLLVFLMMLAVARMVF